MSERWETHKKNEAHDKENGSDGLIDNKTIGTYISNWDYVAELLNTYEETMENQSEKISELKEILNLLEQKNDKLEELLMIRRLQEKQHTVKVDVSDIKGVGDMLDECHDYITALEHELNALDGLYASDNPEFHEPFRLDFTKVLKKGE